MISDAFVSLYPNLAAVLLAVKQEQPSDGGMAAAAAGELAAASADERAPGELLKLFGGQPHPDNEFIRFSLAAYRLLNLSEPCRKLLGKFWAEAVSLWSNADRTAFLSYLLSDPDEVFLALDIAIGVFQRVEFTGGEMFPWISEAYDRVINNMFQRGFWGSVEAFCSRSPQSAIIVAGRWLNSGPPSSSLNVVSNMLSWLRNAVSIHSSISGDFTAVESG